MFFLDSTSSIENYFSGIAYSDKSIVLSLEGMLEYIQSNNQLLDLESGRYSLVYSDFNRDSTLIMTDPTGQDILYFYQEADYWAISNSFYKLIKELKNRNIKMEVYLPALYATKIKHSLGGQPLSNNTLIENIRIIPRDHVVNIKSNNVSIEKRSYKSSPITTIQEYKRELNRVVTSQISVLKSLVESLPEGNVRCDISGGMDSRVVFGICNYVESHSNKIKYSSNPRLEDDYFIAQKLALCYGVKLNNSAIGSYERSIKESEQYLLYKYGNAGVYNTIYKPNYSFTPRTLHIHGAGGESLRGQYQGSPRQIIGRLKNHFSSIEQYNLVQQEFFNYFLENGLDINDPKSMVYHSRSFRARFHFGRNWFRFLTNPLYTPLSDIRLERLADFLSNLYDDPSIIFYDIYLLLDDLLAFLPFDGNEKNLDIAKLQKVNIALSRPHEKQDLEEYVVYGEFTENKMELDVTGNNVLEDSFEELLDHERNLFIQKYPQFEADYARFPHVYNILNIL